VAARGRAVLSLLAAKAQAPSERKPPTESPAEVARARWSWWDAAAILVALAFTVIYAWPASIEPWRYVWGSHGDALGNAFEYTWASASVHAGQPLTVDHQLAWPFGDALGSLPRDPLFWWFTLGLSLLIGAVAALNIISLVAIPLATWTMYRLALKIVPVPPAAFVAGITYGCSSFVLQNTRGEPTLAQAWVFPLEALALINVLRHPRARPVIAAAAAVALAATVDFYYALFAALMATALSGSWLLLAYLERRRFPRKQVVGLLATGVLGFSLAATIYVGTFGNLQATAGQIRRPANQLTLLAAGPLDFVLPARYNPWLGALRSQYVANRLARTGVLVDLAEVLLPLPILLLAPAGMYLLLAALLRRRPASGWNPLEVGAITAVAVLALWLMVPPTALPRYSLALQWDIYKLAPQFQAYHRAITLVAVGAAVLAAIALAAWLPKRSAVAIPLIAGVCAVILLENFMWPPDRALEVVPPPEYTWIAAHPGNYVLAEYPLFTNDAGGNEWTYDFNTRFHDHPIINGHISNTENASMRVELEDPNRPGVAAELATLGVRYVVWHGDLATVGTAYAKAPVHNDSSYRPQTPGYTEQASFPDQAVVFSVDAAPDPAFAFFASGFGAIDSSNPGETGRWLLAKNGTLDVYEASGRSSERISLECTTASGEATMSLASAGSSIGGWQLSDAQASTLDFSFPVTAGINRVRISVSAAGGQADKTAFCTLPVVAPAT
jgi:hypothetical protein